MKENKNQLIGRHEVTISMNSLSNPGIARATSEISEKFKVKPELIVIKNLHSSFGKNTFTAHALIYDSEDVRKRFEPVPKAKKQPAGAQ